MIPDDDQWPDEAKFMERHVAFDFEKAVAEARAIYEGMSNADKARHDYEQRRSFVRGMCPSNRDYDEWCRQVDMILPPTKPI